MQPVANTLGHNNQSRALLALQCLNTTILISGHRSVLDNTRAFFHPYYESTFVDRSSLHRKSDSVHVITELNEGSGPPPQLDTEIYLSPPLLIAKRNQSLRFSRPGTTVAIEIDESADLFKVSALHLAEIELELRFIIRDLIIYRVEYEAGYKMVHASLVECRGRGIAFIGEKNAGKTTSLLSCAYKLGCNLISSDRIKIIANKYQSIVAIGAPGRYNVNLKCFSDVGLLQNVSISLPGTELYNGKALVSADAIASSAKVNVARSANLRLVIAPFIDESAEDLHQEALSAEEIAALFEAHTLDEVLGGRHTPWLWLYSKHSRPDNRPHVDLKSILSDGNTVLGIRVVAPYGRYIQWIGALDIEELLLTDSIYGVR